MSRLTLAIGGNISRFWQGEEKSNHFVTREPSVVLNKAYSQEKLAFTRA